MFVVLLEGEPPLHSQDLTGFLLELFCTKLQSTRITFPVPAIAYSHRMMLPTLCITLFQQWLSSNHSFINVRCRMQNKFLSYQQIPPPELWIFAALLLELSWSSWLLL
ncbi:hypothetical protein AMECASPLE_004304 [Ameca splendens]|uniref:Uncharacterized protein n=1 Tax=Ameca splendens TaxID=208324 RepID=A0ABV0ZUQ9_9TELE